MKRIVLLVVSVIAPLYLLAGSSINLSDAITRHVVTMDAVMLAGKYTGRSLKLRLTNTSNATLDVKVNTGIILKNSNGNYTQLVLPGGEMLSLKPQQCSDVDVQIFSDNAIKACPVEGLHYTFVRTSGEMTTKIIEYVRQQGLFDQLGQAAVWAMTNYLALHCVYDPNRHRESEKLVSFIAANTKRPKPAYYTTYETYEVAGQRCYVGKADKIYVPFDVNLPMARMVRYELYTAQGVFVKSLGGSQMVPAGKQVLTAELAAADYDTGKYIVRLMDGDRLIRECAIFAEQPWITFKD